MTPSAQRAVGAALVLLGVAELASMAVGQSLLRTAFCSPAPTGVISDCVVPDAVRVVVLLGVLGGGSLLATRPA